LYFYYKSSGIYFLILIASTVVDYTLANYIYRTPVYWKKLSLMTFSLVINLGCSAILNTPTFSTGFQFPGRADLPPI